MKKRVHVAVGVIQRPDTAILVAKRPEHAHQGGLWEFPGGKVEPGESVLDALQRELAEELGIQVTATRPLIQIAHDYVDKSVLLDVWTVVEFQGEPVGREGQPLRWSLPAAFDPADFPAANRPIIQAVRLPSAYWITPEPVLGELDSFWQRVQRALDAGVSLIQLRAKQLDVAATRPILQELVRRSAERHALVVVNRFIELAPLCAGVHLTASQLSRLQQRPLPAEQWLAASCHSEAELQAAAKLGCDFTVLSPVLPTASHPEALPLGWETFAELARTARMPVYALGGMTLADVDRARQAGGQGVAGISLYA